MALKTIYVGPVIQCKSLTELDINLDGSIGVDESGKVSFVTRDHSTWSDPGWSDANVVHLGKNEFLFPGFIGEYSSTQVDSLF
jgi:guanine deaminase